MPEFTILEVGNASPADGSPAGCSLCGAIEGPFVIVSNSTYTVNTVNGPMVVDKPLQFCSPKRDETDTNIILRQGCAGSMAIVIGYVGPEVLAGAQASIAEHVEKQAQLEEKITELTAAQVNVVSVDDLMALMDKGGKTAAAAKPSV